MWRHREKAAISIRAEERGLARTPPSWSAREPTLRTTPAQIPGGRKWEEANFCRVSSPPVSLCGSPKSLMFSRILVQDDFLTAVIVWDSIRMKETNRYSCRGNEAWGTYVIMKGHTGVETQRETNDKTTVRIFSVHVHVLFFLETSGLWYLHMKKESATACTKRRILCHFEVHAFWDRKLNTL